MIQVSGWWIPYEGDFFHIKFKKVIEGEGGYQTSQRQLSFKNLRRKRTAIDVGAHVGFWSRDLAHEFERVVAIEPVSEHLECFRKNIIEPNVEIVQAAVGEMMGTCDLKFYQENSGKTHRIEGDSYPLITIDSLNLENVDYIKIDVEGFEKQVLIGAKDTIERCRPRIVIEIKRMPHLPEKTEYKAQKYLLGLGYEKIGKHSTDHFFDFKKLR